jgi:hypothetical protein
MIQKRPYSTLKNDNTASFIDTIPIRKGSSEKNGSASLEIFWVFKKSQKREL